MTEDKQPKGPKKILVVNKASDNNATLQDVHDSKKSSSEQKLNNEEVIYKEEPQELNPLGVPAFTSEEPGKNPSVQKKVILKENKPTDVNPLSNLNGILDEKKDNPTEHKDHSEDKKDESTMDKAKVKMAGAAAGTVAVAGGAYSGAKNAMSSEDHKNDVRKEASEHNTTENTKDTINSEAEKHNRTVHNAVEKTKETGHNVVEKTKETGHKIAEKGHETKENIKEEADKCTDRNESNSSKIKAGLGAAGAGIAGVAVGAYAGAKSAMSSDDHKVNENKMTTPNDMTNKSHNCNSNCKPDVCPKSKGLDQAKVIHVKENDNKSQTIDEKDKQKGTEEDNKSNSTKIKAGFAAAGVGIAGAAAGAYASAKSAVSKPDEKKDPEQDKDKVIHVKGSSPSQENKMNATTGAPGNHVSINENLNESYPMRSSSRHPEKLANIDDSSIIHELRRSNSILTEGFAYKKRPWLFCFWVRKYFILLKSGELFFLEEDGTGEKADFWNIKKATAIKKYDYYDYSHPYRLTFATDVSDGYVALDSEFDRDYWSKALLETSRCN